MKGRLVSALHLKSRSSPQSNRDRVPVPPPGGGRNPLLDLAPPIHAKRAPTATTLPPKNDDDGGDKPRPRKQPSLLSLPSETSIFFAKYTGNSTRSMDVDGAATNAGGGGIFAAPFAHVRDEEDDERLNQLKLLSANMLSHIGTSSHPIPTTSSGNNRALPMAAIEDLSSEHSENEVPPTLPARQSKHLYQQQQLPPHPPARQAPQIAHQSKSHNNLPVQNGAMAYQQLVSASGTVNQRQPSPSFAASASSVASSLSGSCLDDDNDDSHQGMQPPQYLRLRQRKSHSHSDILNSNGHPKKNHRLKHIFSKSKSNQELISPNFPLHPQSANLAVAQSSPTESSNRSKDRSHSLKNIFHRSHSNKEMTSPYAIATLVVDSPASSQPHNQGMLHHHNRSLGTSQSSSDNDSSSMGSTEVHPPVGDHTSWPNPAQPMQASEVKTSNHQMSPSFLSNGNSRPASACGTAFHDNNPTTMDGNVDNREYSQPSARPTSAIGPDSNPSTVDGDSFRRGSQEQCLAAVGHYRVTDPAQSARTADKKINDNDIINNRPILMNGGANYMVHADLLSDSKPAPGAATAFRSRAGRSKSSGSISSRSNTACFARMANRSPDNVPPFACAADAASNASIDNFSNDFISDHDFAILTNRDLDSIPPYATAAAATAAASANSDHLPKEFMDAMAPHYTNELEDDPMATQRLQQQELDRALARKLMEEEDAEAARRFLEEQRRIEDEHEFLARQLIIEEEAEYERRRNESMRSAYLDRPQPQQHERVRRSVTDPEMERRRQEEREAYEERLRRMERNGMYRRLSGPREVGGAMGAPPQYQATPRQGSHQNGRGPNDPLPRHSTGGMINRTSGVHRDDIDEFQRGSRHSAPHTYGRGGRGPYYAPDDPFRRPRQGPYGPQNGYYGRAGGPRPQFPPQGQPAYYEAQPRHVQGDEFLRDPLASMMERRRASQSGERIEILQRLAPPPPDHRRSRYFDEGGGDRSYSPPKNRRNNVPPDYDNYQEDEDEKNDEVWVEISPGLQVALRKSEETREAIANDFFQPVQCMGCSMDMFTIADSSYVICPACRFVSPLEGLHDERFRHCQKHGLGMGVTNEQLIQIQAEVLMER